MKDELRHQTGKERQGRWRDRQKKAGNKVLTITLSQEAKEILEKEKERTAETLSSIINRALINAQSDAAGISYNPNNSGALDDRLAATSDNLPISRKKKDQDEDRNVLKVIPSEETFHSFFENARDLMSIIDKDGNLTYVNNSFAESLGYARDEIVGMHIAKLLGITREKFDYHFKKLILVGRLELETIWITKNGDEIFGEEKVNAVYDDNGRFIGARGVLRDITQRKLAEKVLKERELELAAKNKSLEEMNITLRVLLKRGDEDKIAIEQKILLNIQELIIPYAEQLNMTGLDVRQKSLLSIMESNLKDIVSPFVRDVTAKYLKLTPTEIKVATLVRQGKTTKEIAELSNLSVETIEFYRKSIRKKMGITNIKENLRTRLLALHTS